MVSNLMKVDLSRRHARPHLKDDDADVDGENDAVENQELPLLGHPSADLQEHLSTPTIGGMKVGQSY